MDPAYAEYVRREWRGFVQSQSPLAALALRVLGHEPERVLDVGCGSGQELMPFAASGMTVGVDVEPTAPRVGLALYREERPALRPPALQLAAAEALPFRSGVFDLVLCRLALPYTDNARALGEMTRVLAPGGVLILKIHHLRYYVRQLRRAVPRGDLRSVVHAARVIAFGAVYQLTGRQLQIRRPSGVIREVFQLVPTLAGQLERRGVRVEQVEDGGAATPTLVCRKV